MEGPSKCAVWARLGGPTEYDPGRFNIERPPLPELALGTAFGHVRKTAIGFNRFDEAQFPQNREIYRQFLKIERIPRVWTGKLQPIKRALMRRIPYAGKQGKFLR